MILSGGVPQLQHPVLTAGLVEGGEPLVRSVAEHPRGQQVGVPVSDPGHLIETIKHVKSRPHLFSTFPHRQIAQIFDGAGDIGCFPLDADDSFARSLHEVGPREGPGGVGSDVVVELAQVVARPPGGVP